MKFCFAVADPACFADSAGLCFADLYFGPVGPYLVSPDSIDPTNVSVKTYVNDELRQDGHTSHLRHSVADLIEYLTEFTTLYAGDMIWSGTPEGISHVYAGDVMRCEVEGIGALENPVN